VCRLKIILEDVMDFGSINWLAVVLGVVASMVIGGIWFGPKTFFPIWWKAVGKAGEPGQANVPEGQMSSSLGMGMVWGGVILAALVQAIFMNLMVHAMGSMSGGTSLVSGALAGFLLWLGFVAPSSLTNKLFADRLPAWVLEQGNHLLTFVAMGAIAGAMG
jgi:hypothetical protein